MAASRWWERPPTAGLAGVAVLERSVHGHVQVPWVFPSCPAPLRDVVFARANFTEPCLSRFGSTWLYSFALKEGLSARISGLAVVVWGSEFAPEPYLTLAKVLGEAYRKAGETTPQLLAAWLAAATTGRIPRELPADGSLAPREGAPAGGAAWDLAAFDTFKSFRPTGARALLAGLGVEAILVWTALLLRKRVAVVGRALPEVIRAVRILPLLAAHRWEGEAVASGCPRPADTPASLMWPVVTLSGAPFAGGPMASPAAAGGEGAAAVDTWADNAASMEGPLGQAFAAAISAGVAAQLADLSSPAAAGAGWVAGFTDTAALAQGGDLWDVAVDLSGSSSGGQAGAARVVVAEAARPDLALGPIHKEVAKALLEALASPDATDGSVIAAVSLKTRALVDKLAAWLPAGLPLGCKAPAPAPADGSAGAAEGAASGPVPVDAIAAFQRILRREGLPPSADRFLLGLAAAEPRLRPPTGVDVLLAAPA